MATRQAQPCVSFRERVSFRKTISFLGEANPGRGVLELDHADI
jgi:hypothetical protein